MATIQQYKMSQISALLGHNNRREDDTAIRENESIDKKRTHLNYSLMEGGGLERFRQRLDEVMYYPRVDTNYCVECIITLPVEIKEGDEKKFFASCFNYLAEKFGRENIFNAMVHMDETRPHLHLDFIPVTRNPYEPSSNTSKKAVRDFLKKHPEYEGTNDYPRIASKEVLNRTFFISFHDELQAYTERDLGYPTGIRNGATEKGNLTVLRLKNKTLTKEIEKKEKEIRALAEAAASVRQLMVEAQLSPENMNMESLSYMIEEYQRQNKAMMEIIRRAGYQYTPEDIQKLAFRAEAPKKDLPMQILPTHLRAEDILATKPYLLVVEVDDTGAKPFSPQRDLFTDLRLERSYRTFLSEKAATRILKRPEGEIVYLRNSSREDLFRNLMFLQELLEQKEREDATVYAEAMELDKAHLLRAILEGADQHAVYALRIAKDGEELLLEQQK